MQYVYICYTYTHTRAIRYRARSRTRQGRGGTRKRQKRRPAITLYIDSFSEHDFYRKTGFVSPRRRGDRDRWKFRKISDVCDIQGASLSTTIVPFYVRLKFRIRVRTNNDCPRGTEINSCIARDRSEDRGVARKNVDNVLRAVATLTLKKKNQP